MKWQIIAVLDDKTCDLCRSQDGLIVDEPPQLPHAGCKCGTEEDEEGEACRCVAERVDIHHFLIDEDGCVDLQTGQEYQIETFYFPAKMIELLMLPEGTPVAQVKIDGNGCDYVTRMPVDTLREWLKTLEIPGEGPAAPAVVCDGCGQSPCQCPEYNAEDLRPDIEERICSEFETKFYEATHDLTIAETMGVVEGMRRVLNHNVDNIRECQEVDNAEKEAAERDGGE